ncbi:MAG: PH domain-containing protein [Acidimicrobiia bacterium]|jgi:putative membrane protein
MLVNPDRRWVTKQWLVFGTITGLLVLSAAIAHLVVELAVADNDDASLAIMIIWLAVGGAVALMWLIATPIVLLWFRNLSYLVEDDKVIIRKGVLTKTQQNIPINMVTDFRLQRTLYDRALRIGSILIQTAGQSANPTGYEGKLTGLADWDALHEDLRRRIRPRAGRILETQRSDPLDDILGELREIRRVLETSGSEMP